ncbi:hypothetical protein HOY34_01475 [Xinfangfangia sp. D13-10-4-6]|uniref:hypothetical protein n=1 Tax=Pseudogemmobacter hezensis TaxID=2737662 RepID=UPI001556D332|nr:hypothetical protein [Pseudogemmobacter hezensis]NPD13868.1 hypothetical protein [Pseudogemmobacter hezensis]
MSSTIALLALLSWPAMVWLFYSRMGPGRALIWSVLGAYMVLPELAKIDLPMLPDPNKHMLPALTAALLSWLMLGRRLQIFNGNILIRVLVAGFLISPFFTAILNTDPIFLRYGLEIPGMRIYDSIAITGTEFMYLLPMFLARRDLATPEAMRDLLTALVIAALLYTVPILIESALSPQLHIWVYGYFQHDFGQAVRFGGWRPFVFMPHGLWVAFFVLSCLIAAAITLRVGPAERRVWQLPVFLLVCALLILCKSFGPIAYALAALPLAFLANPRQILAVTGLLAAIVILYPLLRGAHLVPVDAISDIADGLSEDRAQSFGYRLMNEDKLLARAAERPLFGWGGYGRGFVYDAQTGEVETVADGAWIIRIGAFGWVGYIIQFGLLCLPLWLLGREAAAKPGAVGLHAAGVALILALNLVDLLPNGTLTPLTWLMAGALLGHAEALLAARQAKHQAELAAAPRRTII